MKKLNLKKKTASSQDKPSKAPASLAADDEEEFDDDDFFGSGLDGAEKWASKNAPTSGDYKPEFWVGKDEQYNKVVFADPSFHFAVNVHTVKEGKRFNKITCCANSRPCRYCEVASKDGVVGFSRLTFMWRIWNYRKWETDGKVKWVSRKLWPLGKATSETLDKTMKKYGEKARDMIFEIVKGSGKGSFNLIPTEMTDKQRARIPDSEEHFSKSEFRDLYRPPSDEEAEAHIERLMGTKSSSADSFDDDDDE